MARPNTTPIMRTGSRLTIGEVRFDADKGRTEAQLEDRDDYTERRRDDQ